MIESFGTRPEISDECGVFGIWAPGVDVARTTFFALYALQHRGQESAGIATTDGQRAYLHRGTGLVTQAFDEGSLAPLKGSLAIGHTRYSTMGGPHLRNAQPYVLQTLHGPLGIAHNGNLTNATELRRELLQRGGGLSTASDSELLLHLLTAPLQAELRADLPDRVARLAAILEVAEGAYSVAVLTAEGIYAMRDPRGFRPLCIGEIGKGLVISSESCALETIGARYLREIEPGEIVFIGEGGLQSWTTLDELPEPSLCVFEHVYFARPDSILEGRTVHSVRERCGRRLAKEAPAEADLVVGVPDSALPAAVGYALESGIPYREGLIKNRYIGRTFIQPDAELRKDKVRLKYNPLRSSLEGQRVVLVDDSIVRGNTAGPLVRLIRGAGAVEVHVRISSPPVRYPCFMGVDLGSQDEIIGAHKTVEQIREHIGADSLSYLSEEGMMGVVREGLDSSCGHCRACFNGTYPAAFDAEANKERFEGIHGQ